MDDRDMYYNSYGYGGFTPNAMPGGFPQMMNTGMPNQMYPAMNTGMGSSMSGSMPANNYANSQFNDMNERVSRLERQVKHLDQRLTRLETPYANTNNFNQEPDNNMYMM